MKYSYEFKKECVRLYRLGEWADTPKGMRDKQFRDMIMIWHRLEDLHGPEILKHNSSRVWTADEKLVDYSQVNRHDFEKLLGVSEL